MVGWVAGELGDADADAVVHAHDTHLGDWVLFEEFADVFLRESNHCEVAIWTHVLFEHGLGEVEYEDYMTDDSALESFCVLS